MKVGISQNYDLGSKITLHKNTRVTNSGDPESRQYPTVERAYIQEIMSYIYEEYQKILPLRFRTDVDVINVYIQHKL